MRTSPVAPRSSLASLLSAVLLAGAFACSSGLVSPAEARALPGELGIGLRIGGWGFRDPEAAASSDRWRDCRMNGLGIFLESALTTRLYAEVGLDTYFSDDFGLSSAPGREAMDRLSGLLTGAIGLRSNLAGWISAYAQIGAGLELTKVRIGDSGSGSGHHHGPGSIPSDDGQPLLEGAEALPVGFFGVGADLRLTGSLRAGMVYRALAMGHFDRRGPLGPGAELGIEPEMASQVQLYVRWAL